MTPEEAVRQIWTEAKKYRGFYHPDQARIRAAVVQSLSLAKLYIQASAAREAWENHDHQILQHRYSRERDRGRAFMQNDLRFAREFQEEIREKSQSCG